MQFDVVVHAEFDENGNAVLRLGDCFGMYKDFIEPYENFCFKHSLIMGLKRFIVKLASGEVMN